MEGDLTVVIHSGSLEHQQIHGGNTSASDEPAVMESPSGLVIQDGSVLHQYILESNIADPDDEMDPDHEMEGESTSEEEEERMSSHRYKGFNKHGDAGTITPHSQANVEHDRNVVGGDRTIVAIQTQASSGSNSIYRSDHIKAVHPKKSTHHGYKQGAARFRSGQRLAANEQLSKQVNILHAQLGLAKDSAKAELAGEFNRHVANVEAEVRVKENARMAEWVRRSTSSISCLTFFAI